MSAGGESKSKDPVLNEAERAGKQFRTFIYDEQDGPRVTFLEYFRDNGSLDDFDGEGSTGDPQLVFDFSTTSRTALIRNRFNGMLGYDGTFEINFYEQYPIIRTNLLANEKYFVITGSIEIDRETESDEGYEWYIDEDDYYSGDIDIYIYADETILKYILEKMFMKPLYRILEVIETLAEIQNDENATKVRAIDRVKENYYRDLLLKWLDVMLAGEYVFSSEMQLTGKNELGKRFVKALSLLSPSTNKVLYKSQAPKWQKTNYRLRF